MLTDIDQVRPASRHSAHWANASSSTQLVSVLHQAGVLGQRQELQWRDEPERGVGPPDQRLDGEDLARAQVQLRLVVQDEVALFDRDAQLLDHVQLSSPPSIVLVVEDVGDVAQLRAVHRGIRAPGQPDRFGGVGRGEGDADARADAGLHLLQDERLADLA